MTAMKALDTPEDRRAPIAMHPADFRSAGHRLVDQIAGWMEAMADGPVVHDESPADVRRVLGADRRLPEAGSDTGALLDEATALLFQHSIFNGHPRFFGYITSSPAPLGALADLLASAVNQNVGAWRLAPMATEIEAQTIRWIAELIGFPSDAGGLLVSGGNMANFVCFLAARTAKASADVRTAGLQVDGGAAPRLCVGRNTYLDSQGRRSVRPRHRCDSMDSNRRGATDGHRGARAPDPLRQTRGRTAIPGGRNRRLGRHRGRRSPAGDCGDLPPARPLVSRGWCVRRIRCTCAWSARQPARAGGGGLGRCRSAQVAVRTARSRMRAGAPPRRSAADVLVPSELLPVRPRSHQLLRLRSAEFTRLSRPEGLAGAAPGGTRRAMCR